MNKAKQATFRTLLAVEYGELLIKVRRGQKGLRMAYLYSIQIVGEYPEGIRLCDMCRLCGKAKGNISKRLTRCMNAGYIYKSERKYYLTDSGRMVYNLIIKETKPIMDEIVRLLMDEVRRKM